MNLALENATEKSLLIIDEFGKGTLPSDGIGLYAAVIESFASRGPLQCPRLLTATHFSEIFEFKLINPFPSHVLAQRTMEVVPLREGEDGKNGIAFLYRVGAGVTSSSWGLNCALMAGIGKDVIDRAAEVSTMLTEGKSLSPARASSNRMTDSIEHAVKEFVAMNLLDTTEIDKLFGLIR